MTIGYACLTVGVKGTKLKSCILKNATPENLSTIIQSNLQALDNVIDYNIKNQIKVFRISSDIIPFGSHPVNTLRWWEDYKDQLKAIGNKALENGIRLSMHPGQYTVLNSTHEGVVERARADLKYHTLFLDALGLGQDHKIILHIGGIYGDKASAIKRFIKEYRKLDENIKRRLVIENDDKLYNISDLLLIGESQAIPVVFDNLHHEVNPSNKYTDYEWIHKCSKTWKPLDGPQKLHYSQQDPGKRLGSHSSTLDVDSFLKFYRGLPNEDVDIMVEVKDKNLSAIKCINAIGPPKIQELEKEWGRYKYAVLENSPNIYKEIRLLLKDKTSYPVKDFYRLIDNAMMAPIKPGNAVNAAQHVWGYFKNTADKPLRQRFEKLIQKVSIGGSTRPIKRLLWQLVEEQEEDYLMDSLYFYEV